MEFIEAFLSHHEENFLEYWQMCNALLANRAYDWEIEHGATTKEAAEAAIKSEGCLLD